MKKISTSAYVPTEIDVESLSENSVKISAYPFQTGYAITLAHPLRRLLYSCTVGYAPVAIKIQGVSHEFDSMRGMLEDVALFIINLKNIRFKIKGDEDKVELNYNFTGSKEIKGSDLDNEQIEVVTKDAYLATINEDATLNFSLIVQKGIGYVPSEDIREEIDESFIALDAFFTPVKKVTYDIENVLVEDNPNYEKIVFHIKTDGQISPIDAFKNSLEAMYKQMAVFNGVLEIDMKQLNKAKTTNNEFAKLLVNINNLNLSARSYNCLDKAKISIIAELALMSETELKELKNLGKKSLDEIKDVMENSVGYKVGYEFKDEEIKYLKAQIDELKSKLLEEK